MNRKPAIVLPRTIYALMGDESHREEINIYFKNIITGYSQEMVVDIRCAYGKQYQDFWRLETGGGNPLPDQKEFPLTVRVLDRCRETLCAKTVTVEMVSRAITQSCRVLCIGDSMTRAAVYVRQLQETLEGVKTVGTRTYDDGIICTEGRGGWKVTDYLNPTRSHECSPFMFPKGIEGSRYQGYTAFWSHVCHQSPKEYPFEGFQKIARDWEGDDADYRYDAEGFPVTPREGDVVLHSGDGEGKLLIWNMGKWMRLGSEPPWEFSFEKYLERYKPAFMREGELKKPDIVTMLFGANDFQWTDGIKEGINGYMEGIKTMIHSIKSYDPEIFIIINLPVLGASQDAWGINRGSGGNAFRYDLNMQELSMEILKEWDCEDALWEGIMVCPMGMGLDPVYGFDMVEEQANKYSNVRVKRHSNWIHPNEAGYRQMGDVLAGVVQYIRNRTGR